MCSEMTRVQKRSRLGCHFPTVQLSITRKVERPFQTLVDFMTLSSLYSSKTSLI